MQNIMDFMAWAASHASPARIPEDSALCVPLADVGAQGVWQYLYGTTGRLCTQSLLDAKYERYYRKWGYSRAEYDLITRCWVADGVTVCDCQGLEDYYSGSDTNAKGNYKKYCTDKGKIKEITRDYVIGEALFCGKTAGKINHVGWVAGWAPDGELLILHERGIRYGCLIERISRTEKEWTYRGLMTKRYSYEQPEPEPAPDGPRILRIADPLMRGEDVQKLQEALNALGYDAGVADGICGPKTMEAINYFVKIQKED